MLARLKGDKRGQPAHLPYASSRWSQSAAVRSATATAFCARGARILMSQPRSQLGRATTSMPLNPHTMSMSSCTRGPGCAVRGHAGGSDKTLVAELCCLVLKQKHKKRRFGPFAFLHRFW